MQDAGNGAGDHFTLAYSNTSHSFPTLCLAVRQVNISPHIDVSADKSYTFREKENPSAEHYGEY
jgi:hypothetical protein